MYKLLSTLSLLLVLGSISSAQIVENGNLMEDNTIPKDSAYYSESNFVGTFQIIHKTKQLEIFTYDIYYEIEARRSETEVVLWNVSPHTTFRIFPRNLIYPPLNYRIQETEIYEH